MTKTLIFLNIPKRNSQITYNKYRAEHTQSRPSINLIKSHLTSTKCRISIIKHIDIIDPTK